MSQNETGVRDMLESKLNNTSKGIILSREQALAIVEILKQPLSAKIDEEMLEKEYWEYDSARAKKFYSERDLFKQWMRSMWRRGHKAALTIAGPVATIVTTKHN